MRVFISWSGELSKQVAELLGPWIEDVLQDVQAWISSDDIDKGSIWFTDITSELADTTFGIICLTRENVSAPWILFEAGALSKGLTKSRVCPFLVDLGHDDLVPPLSQFNATLPEKSDMLKLIKTINPLSADKALPGDKLAKAFDHWWDDFSTHFQRIVGSYEPKAGVQKRSADDRISEILAIARSLQMAMQELSRRARPLEPTKIPDLEELAQYFPDLEIGELVKATPAQMMMRKAFLESIKEHKAKLKRQPSSDASQTEGSENGKSTG